MAKEETELSGHIDIIEREVSKLHLEDDLNEETDKAKSLLVIKDAVKEELSAEQLEPKTIALKEEVKLTIKPIAQEANKEKRLVNLLQEEVRVSIDNRHDTYQAAVSKAPYEDTINEVKSVMVEPIEAVDHNTLKESASKNSIQDYAPNEELSEISNLTLPPQYQTECLTEYKAKELLKKKDHGTSYELNECSESITPPKASHKDQPNYGIANSEAKKLPAERRNIESEKSIHNKPVPQSIKNLIRMANLRDSANKK
eukprot:TRINITY_DN9748_c0_g1_i6.p1 TRINITY_DN9748_c0_g1~~TRINITY_DN9748_c0_g1_i6.p1  ORF type:complete len:257 (+),score=37.81 TRINITY_DN9748_c0_g1_i6:261-1031(+)